MPRRVYKPRRYTTRRKGYNRKALQNRFSNRRFRYKITRRGLNTLRFNRSALGGFPPRKNITLRYVETISLNPGDGISNTNVFLANNIFDPNYTGTGHQPMFYDNYAALYSKYKVNYATCTMIALNNHVVNTTIGDQVDGTTLTQTQVFASNQRAVRMFILMDESPTDYPNDLDNMIEEGNKRLRWRFAPQNMSSQMQKIRAKAFPARMQNLSKNDHTLAANFGAGPARPFYFICGVDSFDSNNADSMNYQVIITYNVTVFDFIGNQTQN